MVFVRGQLPCDVLFVGEAPGDSENALGVPFIGPAGKLLDRIVEDALQGLYMTPENRGWDKHRIAFTNVVGCYPAEQKQTGDHAPPPEALKACAPKLKELVSLAKPRLVICVGTLATKNIHLSVDTAGPIKVESIVHPAAILRANIAQQGLMIQRSIVTIRTALEDL